MRRILLILAAIVLAGLILTPVVASLRQSSSDRAILRAFRREGSWQFSCGGDTCTGTTFQPLILDVPANPEQMDLTVELSLDFRVSPRDSARIQMMLSAPGGDPKPLSPNTYRLTSSVGGSTTVGWGASNLVAGETYELVPVIDIDDGGPFGYDIRGRNMLIVAEVWG